MRTVLGKTESERDAKRHRPAQRIRSSDTEGPGWEALQEGRPRQINYREKKKERQMGAGHL